MSSSLSRLDPTTRVPALRRYSVVLKSIAAAHPAVSEKALPGGLALQTLDQRSEALGVLHLAWKAARSARGVARSARDGVQGTARGKYGDLYKRVMLVLRTTRGTEALTAALQGCDTPSVLRSEALAEAMETLTTTLAPHLDLFSQIGGVNAQALADVAAQRQALVEAEAALTLADGARSDLAARRQQARIDLLNQIRLVEGALLLDLPPNAVAALKTARARCLPRLVQGASPEEESPVDEVDDEDEDEDDEGSEPTPGG